MLASVIAFGKGQALVKSAFLDLQAIHSAYAPVFAALNCQSEVRIFEEKNEKYHGFTLTKGRVLYIDISRFSEPEEAATNEVGTTLTGC